eukprot:6880891-Pyramimonas_sp.AAC.1
MCSNVSRPLTGVSHMVARPGTPFFTCPGHPGGYPTWLPRVKTRRFNVSRSLKGVSNMAAPSWNQVFVTCPGHPE